MYFLPHFLNFKMDLFAIHAKNSFTFAWLPLIFLHFVARCTYATGLVMDLLPYMRTINCKTDYCVSFQYKINSEKRFLNECL